MSINTLDFIQSKFKLEFGQHLPIEIPNFGRAQLAEMLALLEFKIIVEVGIAEGKYSESLCIANPQAQIYGIDPYEPHRGYNDYTRRSTFEKLETNAHKRLDKFSNYQFIRKYSVDAVSEFENNLDFVYLDADHSYETVTQDIQLWLPKIRSGGILAGHDYARLPHVKVIQAVNDYTSAHKIQPWFVLGREADNEGLIRDKPRSWMWIK
jgi:hypothetical protein